MGILPHIDLEFFNMSMPSFPPNGADMTREDALTMIVASIAMEELALSHILNAEGEKLQYILGTLPGTNPCGPCPPVSGAAPVLFRPARHRARPASPFRPVLRHRARPINPFLPVRRPANRSPARR